MAKISPIRLDVEVVAHLNHTSSYHQETTYCRRYEDNLCRVCDKPRLNLSPWCDDHFPWMTQKPIKLRAVQEP